MPREDIAVRLCNGDRLLMDGRHRVGDPAPRG